MIYVMDTQVQDPKILVHSFRKRNTIWILAIVIIAIICELIGYYIGLHEHNKKTFVEAKKIHESTVTVLTNRPTSLNNTGSGAIPQDPAVTVSPANDMPGWKRFSDPEGFSVEYPADWTMNADSSLEDNPKNEITSLTFVIDKNSPINYPLIAQININPNESELANDIVIHSAQKGVPRPTSIPRSTILAQEVQSLQADSIVSGNPTPVDIDNYPAVEFTAQYYDYIEYYAIAPGIATNEALYSFELNKQQSVYPNYDPFKNTPFLNQQIQNFSKVVMSTKFPQE